MMTTSLRSVSITTVFTATLVVFAPRMQGAEEPTRLIVNCERPCRGVEAAVLLVGGEVTYTYENIDAIAVTIPQDRVADISAAEGVLGAVSYTHLTLPTKA